MPCSAIALNSALMSVIFVMVFVGLLGDDYLAEVCQGLSVIFSGKRLFGPGLKAAAGAVQPLTDVGHPKDLVQLE